MEKAIVLYEKGDKFEKAHVQTLAGEEVCVSKVMVEGKILRDHGIRYRWSRTCFDLRTIRRIRNS